MHRLLLAVERVFRMPICLCLLVALGRCGILELCSNSCPPGWVHGSFDCGCMETENSVGSPRSSDPPPYYATRRYYCNDESQCDDETRASSCVDAITSSRDKGQRL